MQLIQADYHSKSEYHLKAGMKCHVPYVIDKSRTLINYNKCTVSAMVNGGRVTKDK